MAEFIKVLLSAFNTYGFIGILGLGIILLIMALLYEAGKSFIRKYILSRKIGSTKKKLSINDSLFFPITRRLIAHDVDQRFTLNCLKRQAIFRDLLRIKFRSMLEVFTALVAIPVDIMSITDFRTYWIDALAQYTTAWQKEVREAGIPEIALELYVEHHQKNYEIIYDFMNSVIDADNVHDSNTEKSMEILNMIATINRISLKDARDAADAFNGELDDIVYREHGTCADCTRRNRCDRFNAR